MNDADPDVDSLVPNELADRWYQLMRGLGVTSDTARDGWNRLTDRYGEPHRAYHDLRHIADCLGWLDRVTSLAADVVAIEIAIWFHDVIYDTQPRAGTDARAKSVADGHDEKSNEARSAELACAWLSRCLPSGKRRDALVLSVGRLIHLTTHDTTPATGDEALMLDIDLAGLAATEDEFDEAGRRIRYEYSWVPTPKFNSGRSGILQAFLDRPAIYHHAWFRQRLEGKARENLRRAIAALSAPQ